MPTYFARTPRRRKAVRWQMSPAVARLVGMPVRAKRKLKTEEHDAQMSLFKEHIKPRLVAGAVAFAIPNGGHRAKREAIKIKEEGGEPGVPDIFAIHRGQTYLLEMKKTKGGSVRKAQRIMMARLVGAGAICAVASSRQSSNWRHGASWKSRWRRQSRRWRRDQLHHQPHASR
jgi:hypothetical protein